MTKKNCRAMVLTGPEQLEMRTFDLPAIGEDDGLLEVELVGVCGSDPGIFAGRETFGPRPYPLIMGHEIVGRITRLGSAAQERLCVGPGDRVVVEYAFGCGFCEACQGGDYTTCLKHYFYGSMISCNPPPHLFGAYSEYLYLHPRAQVHKIGDGISPEVGVLICAVMANGIRWLRQIGGVSIGQTVAIVGPGQQGLAALAVAREAGAEKVFMVGLARDARRLDMARRFGADRIIVADRENPAAVVAEATAGHMADLVMDATGHPSGAELSLDLASRKGTVILPGIYKGKKASLNLDRAVINEIRMIGVFSHDFKAVNPAIGLARRGTYPFGEMITHRLPLSEAEQAIRMVAGQIPEEDPIKVVLDPKL